MLNTVQCCFSLTADPATWKNPRHLAKGCLYPLAFSPCTWSACLCTLITYISCDMIVDYTFPFTLQLPWWFFLLSVMIDFQFSDFVALESDDICFSSVPLLLHRTSCTFNSQILKRKFCWLTSLNFSVSEKNVLKDYLVVGKPCVCQKARFPVDSSCRADCCVREHRGNGRKLKIGNRTCH